MCLYVPGFQRQVFIHAKILLERSKKMKEQKKNKGSVLVAESACNAQNAHFGLVMKDHFIQHLSKNLSRDTPSLGIIFNQDDP